MGSGKGEKQCVIANNVDESGNPSRIIGNLAHYLGAEQILAFITRFLKSKVDVATYLVFIKRGQTAVKDHSLFQMAEAQLTESCRKLGLAG